MKIRSAVVILALIVCAAAFSGCTSESGNANNGSPAASANSMPENANSAKTNVEELSLLINLPFPPSDEDIVWKLSRDQKKLTAVLRFTPEDAKRIAAEASARQAPQNTTISSETWFPPELIAQSEVGGEDSLDGVAYPAESFYQEPFTSGRIVRIEGTDYFVLELAAK